MRSTQRKDPDIIFANITRSISLMKLSFVSSQISHSSTYHASNEVVKPFLFLFGHCVVAEPPLEHDDANFRPFRLLDAFLVVQCFGFCQRSNLMQQRDQQSMSV